MRQLIHWFQADPRRLCVLGVWLNLSGCALTLHALVSGMPAGQLVLGIALTLLATAASITGRDRFKRQRLSRRRAPAPAQLQPETAS